MTLDQREKLMKISSGTVSDVMEALGFCGETHGIMPLWETCPKLVGEAVTVKMGPTGEVVQQSSELCADAVNIAKPGDVIVIDNHRNVDIACWDKLMASSGKDIAGVAIDGAARDLDYFMERGFPVYARGAAVRSPRGRIMEYETNGVIQFCNRQVRPGDVLLGDRSGIVIIPKELLDEVIARALELESGANGVT